MGRAARPAASTRCAPPPARPRGRASGRSPAACSAPVAASSGAATPCSRAAPACWCLLGVVLLLVLSVFCHVEMRRGGGRSPFVFFLDAVRNFAGTPDRLYQDTKIKALTKTWLERNLT